VATPHKSVLSSSKLEYLKYELKARADESLEQIKSALQVSAIEHQIRFSNLHEKRAGIIAELYSELVKVERDGRIYIYSFGKAPKNEHGEAVPLKTLQEFDSFVEEHRIYFSESICKLLTAFSTSLGPYLVHAHVYGDLGGIDRVSPEIADRRYEGFRQSIEAFRGEIPAARHELEQEFRRILGVS
jgi:hypothetical protein